MYSYLNTMPFGVPWDFQRFEGLYILNENMLASTSLREFISFIMPPVPDSFIPSVEYLVRIDRRGREIERYLVSDQTHDSFLDTTTSEGMTVAYSSGPKDISGYLTAMGSGDLPCGIYYYEVWFAVKNSNPPPQVDPNADPQPDQLHYKTEVFYIDPLRLSQDPMKPGIGVPDQGDFSPFDFNDDYFTTL